MAKKSNILKFDVIEKIISVCECETKEQVVELAEKMRDIACSNKNYSEEAKNAFIDACREINDELSIANIKEIKKIIN